MAFKNHYKTLGIPPNASADAIKKKFRKLALQYHPDINAGNEFAASQFRELQEAYETLSNPSYRAKYNYEWKFHFPDASLTAVVEQTPAALLHECTELNRQIAAMDIYRMNKEAIYQRIKHILSESNIGMLLEHKDEKINQKIIVKLLSASTTLPYRYCHTIAAQLSVLAASDKAVLKKIRDFIQASKNKSYWEKYYPLLVLIITLAICWLIYSISQ